MITAENLSDAEGVRHLFFSRNGGVSGGIYSSLNCGPGSSDDQASVLDNRARAMAALDQEPENLVTVYQYHSPVVVEVHEAWALGEAPKADAMVTTEPGIVLGILTADCAPVLFADADAGVIGAAHAGWKGALGGVIDATVEAMVDAGAQLDRIAAAVGPCIQQPSYEVGADFRSSFLEAGSGNDRFFARGAIEGKFQFDLSGYVRHRLTECSVGSIEILPIDTYTEEDRFFSYRRATHRGEPDYGRELSAIVLEG
ncbi:MAG: peptidoglycan editing factor PgeF [Rhodospirillales bacterium]|nr:peptidoglycan editing factor PgeF [Rhodospirillales bacterium]MBO6785427.1 peptidoglycan editing factor PgeF [Rhodospirillales bacterium]